MLIARKLGFIFLLLICAGESWAFNLKVRQIPQDAQIPSNFVTDIKQLKSGYLLVSTDSGARLYDGYDFIPIIPTESAVNSPLNARVHQTLEDSQGNIWFATALGLYKLESGSATLKKYTAGPSTSNSLVNDNVRRIIEDSQGNIWFGTLKGVSRLDPQTGIFTNFSHTENALKPDDTFDKVNMLLEEPGKYIWVGTPGGLLSIDLITDKWSRASAPLDTAYVTSAIFADTNHIWFGADSAGIYKMDLETRSVELHNTKTQSPYQLKTDNVWALFKDNLGIIWVGYWSSGVSGFDTNLEKTFQLNYRHHDETSLPGNSIESITCDASGLIWFATNGGMASFDQSTLNIDHLFHVPGDKTSINDSYIFSIAEHGNNDVWIGTEEGLEHWRVDDNSVEHYRHNEEDPESISAGAIWKINSVDTNQLLLATDKGIDLFDTQTGKVKHFRDFYSGSGKKLDFAFYAIAEAHDGWFYVASNDGSLHKIHPNTGETELVLDAKANAITEEVEYFTVISVSQNGNLWLGSTTGLYRYNINDGTISSFSANSTPIKLSGNIIYDLFEDKNKTLWIATSTGGINKLSVDSDGKKSLTIISEQTGLPSNEIFNLVALNDEQLWFSTRQDFGYIDLTTEEVKTYSTYTSKHRNFIERASYLGKNGHIYLGGSELIRFNPEKFKDSQFQPEIRFTGISRLHQPISNFLPLQKSHSLELFPDDTLVTFYFSSLDFANPEYNQYRYKLQGYDSDWLTPGSERQATYTHLRPGRFQLMVQGTNRDGFWSSQVSSLDITVHPPFYRSLSAYFIYILTLTLATFLIIRDRKIKRQKELRTMEAIKQSEARLRDVLWGSGDVLWRWNLSTNLVSSTDNLTLESTGQEYVTDMDSLIESMHPEDREQVRDMIERHLKGEEDYYEAQFRVLASDTNSWRWVMSRGRIVERDVKGNPLIVAGTRKNIDDIKKTEKQLRYLANYDQLTQLPNRSLFHEHLSHAIEMAKRFDERIALLFFDLDGFKLINDSLGHAVGDQLLQAVALRLARILRSTDSCARLGGDEFAVIIERVNSNDEVIPTLERLLEELSRPFILNDQSVVTSVSIGIAVYPEDGDQPANLLKHADIAMYETKRGGKKGYRFYEPQMNALLVKRLDVEGELKIALEENQFETFYQPRVSVEDNVEQGYEALIRWRHPDRGLVSPAEFIPIAEETGQILDLGNWILKDACKQGAAWYKTGWRGFISINIAALQFQQSDLVANVEEALVESKMPAQCLELEITEGTLIKDIERTRNIILRLKKIGVKIALDDFGTGYSSLSYLQQLPIDALKIDRSFINLIPHSSKSARLCKAIINMAHSLDLQVVAEGIEEAAQLEFLKEANCEEYQGYLYGKPRPASEIEA